MNTNDHELEMVSTRTLNHSKIDLILRAVNGTKSYEALSKILTEQPGHLFQTKPIQNVSIASYTPSN